MSSKTKIIVLHMKEVIYTCIFLLLLVILGVLVFFMFGPGKAQNTAPKTDSRYTPGIYRTSVQLNNNSFDLEVTVDADSIRSIHLANLKREHCRYVSSRRAGPGLSCKPDLFYTVSGKSRLRQRPEIYSPDAYSGH